MGCLCTRGVRGGVPLREDLPRPKHGRANALARFRRITDYMQAASAEQYLQQAVDRELVVMLHHAVRVMLMPYSCIDSA